jgi:hypothetical protein
MTDAEAAEETRRLVKQAHDFNHGIDKEIDADTGLTDEERAEIRAAVRGEGRK